jgi:pyruvate kinase
MLFAIENNIHIIAASFVRSGDDVRSLRAFFADHGAKVIIFSKIDHREAVDNLIALFGSVRWHHGGAGRSVS